VLLSDPSLRGPMPRLRRGAEQAELRFVMIELFSLPTAPVHAAVVYAVPMYPGSTWM